MRRKGCGLTASLGQLQRYSLTRLSKSLGRSALETSAAENGVLKMMMLELLKSHKDQVRSIVEDREKRNNNFQAL